MLQEAFEKFFIDNGIQKKWFAKQIGMTPQHFYQIMIGKLPVPVKYWKDIIRLTKGAVGIGHLLASRLEDIDFIKVELTQKYNECKVILKDLDIKD